jgi:SP family arabinose:H+ symporter-like MFS transporter
VDSAVSVKAAVNLRYLVLLAAAAALGGLLFGFDIAIITGAGPFLMEHFGLNDLGLGWAFSSLLFGCVLGSLAAGRFADRYGRKAIMSWVAVLFGLTSIATALAPTFHLFVAARFAGGLAVGAVSLLSPMYISEVSPPTIRGRMGALYQMSIVVGILISYGINYLLRNSGPDNWRWMFFTGIFPSILFFVLMLLAPETPRFLMMAGRKPEALHLLARISNRESAIFEVAEIEAALAKGGGGREGMRRPAVKRALKVSFFLAILIHVSGINTIVDYAPAIFRSAGWKMDGALIATFLVGITELLFTITSFWMIDRFGRKPLYVVGSVGMSVSLVLLMITVVTNRFQGPLVLAMILTYLAFFCSCIGPVFWTLVPEIFPTDVRGLAMTVPVLTQWVANAFVVLLFPFAFNQIGKAITFGFLGVMCLTQAVFTRFFVPETKNKPLEEIEDFWNVPYRDGEPGK